MKNRRTVIVAFMLIAVMVLGVGYAALSDTLTIIGNAHIDLSAAEAGFDEKVYFSAAEATSSNGTGTTADAVSFKFDDATYTANKLALKEEQSVFTFTIKNDYDLPVYIIVAEKKLSGVDNPSNSNAENFVVTYAYPQGQTIAANGGTITVVVTVKVKESITSATSATFGMELTATTQEPVSP